MHFVIHAIDRPDAQPRRLAIIDQHRAYLETGPREHDVNILLSGPLKSDDDTIMIGSFFLVDAPSRDAVDSMLEGDPIHNADVWESVAVSRVFLRQNSLTAAMD